MTETNPAARRLQQILAHKGIDRGFLADAPIRHLTLEGKAGVALEVRLTSYRALPLSCIAGIEIAIDGEAMNMAQARLGLGGLYHRLDELAAISGASWFILDFATLFVPLAAKLAPGVHLVTGTLCTVEPYITAGRFAFYNSSSKQLSLEEPVA